MKSSNLFKSVFVIAILSAVVCSQGSKDIIPTSEFTVNTCENSIRIMAEIERFSDSNKTMIIVSYLGKGESLKFKGRRLHNARAFVTQPQYAGRDKNLVVTAEGARSAGKGYLDFFIGGILEYRILFPKNADFVLSGCHHDSVADYCSTAYENLFYPCLGRKRQKSRRKSSEERAFFGTIAFGSAKTF